MKSSIGGCGVGGEDVSMGQKTTKTFRYLSYFLKTVKVLSEYMTRGMIISLDGHIGYYLQQGVEQVIIALSTRPLRIIPQFGTFL